MLQLRLRRVLPLFAALFPQLRPRPAAVLFDELDAGFSERGADRVECRSLRASRATFDLLSPVAEIPARAGEGRFSQAK